MMTIFSTLSTAVRQPLGWRPATLLLGPAMRYVIEDPTMNPLGVGGAPDLLDLLVCFICERKGFKIRGVGGENDDKSCHWCFPTEYYGAFLDILLYSQVYFHLSFVLKHRINAVYESLLFQPDARR